MIANVRPAICALYAAQRHGCRPAAARLAAAVGETLVNNLLRFAASFSERGRPRSLKLAAKRGFGIENKISQPMLTPGELLIWYETCPLKTPRTRESGRIYIVPPFSRSYNVSRFRIA
jgi:hypothetical protein